MALVGGLWGGAGGGGVDKLGPAWPLAGPWTHLSVLTSCWQPLL